ncbi:MAG: MFS transporter [Planctomycetes bacterium]|nr:MFS transporter [Planctomycetota bacterium]
MNLWRRLLFACGQLGIMGLARFFFSWIVKYPEVEPDGYFYSWFVRAGDQLAALLSSSSAESLPQSLGRTFLFSATLIGTTVFAFRIFDGVTDPLAGGLSEAWVRRGRQRRTLLWGSFLLPPLGLALIFMPTHAMLPSLRWGLLVTGMFVFFVGYTFYAIPYWTLIEDYAQGDVKERTLLSNLLGVGVFAAVAVVALLSPKAIEAWGYGVAALVFAAPCALLMILPYFAAPPERADAPPVIHDPDAPGLWIMIKRAFAHRRFVAVLFLFAGSQMSFTFFTSAGPFIAEKLLGGSTGDVSLLMAPFLGTAFLGFFGVPWLSRRLGWEKAVVLASLLLGLVYAGSAGLGYGVIGGPWTTAMLCFGCGGPMAAVLLGLEGEAISSCATDSDGGGSVSVYFGVFNFVIKGLNGLAIFLGGILADAARGEWGNTAVRLMAFSAGGMLVVGVVGYFLVRPRDAAPAAAVKVA